MSSELIFGLFCLVFVVGTFWLSAVFEGRRRDREQKTRRVLKFLRPDGFSYAVVEGFEPSLAVTPNIISSDAPSAARTHHQ